MSKTHITRSYTRKQQAALLGSLLTKNYDVFDTILSFLAEGHDLKHIVETHASILKN